MDPGKFRAVLDWPQPTSIKQNRLFIWTSEANHAFNTLKQCFTSTPILTLPDPVLPFMLEVDASDGRNYDIGNQELLAINMALEEWRHWLEGAKHPFIIWMDHQNLIYIRDTK
ncbi:hypothetical protein M9458_043151, partial [Cirrhinus mrigala]